MKRGVLARLLPAGSAALDIVSRDVERERDHRLSSNFRLVDAADIDINFEYSTPALRRFHSRV